MRFFAAIALLGTVALGQSLDELNNDLLKLKAEIEAATAAGDFNTMLDLQGEAEGLRDKINQLELSGNTVWDDELGGNSWDYVMPGNWMGVLQLVAEGQFDPSYYPSSMEAWEDIYNTLPTWVRDFEPSVFDFESSSWSKDRFNVMMRNIDVWLVNDMNMYSLNQTACWDYDICDVDVLNLGDYIQVLKDIETDLEDTDWYATAMADPSTDLTDAQLQEVADILNDYVDQLPEFRRRVRLLQDTVTVDMLKELQKQAQQQGFNSFDDLSEQKLCEIAVAEGEFSPQDAGFSSCADITPEKIFQLGAAALEGEEGIKLSDYGVNSFDDINEANLFAQMDSQMKANGMKGISVRSVSDLTADSLIKTIEENGVTVDDEMKKSINENFSEVQGTVIAAQEQARAVAEAAGIVQPQTDSGAYAIMATMTAAATAIAALAF